MLINKGNKIEFGDCEISINIGDTIIGFDILLSGKYELEQIDIPNFMMTYKNNRVIGIGFGSKLGRKPFLKYTGVLSIMKCIVVTETMEKIHILPSSRVDTFNHTFDNIDGVNTKFEDMSNNHLVGDLPRKTKATFNNDNIYIDGKKIDPNISTDKKRVKRAVQTIKTMRTTGGGYLWLIVI